jgi:hypothetical protein
MRAPVPTTRISGGGSTMESGPSISRVHSWKTLVGSLTEGDEGEGCAGRPNCGRFARRTELLSSITGPSCEKEKELYRLWKYRWRK